MPINILLVEDEKNVKRVVQHILVEIGGYRVETASNGQEALEILDNTDIDLIVSDLNMPILDGYELLTTIRSTPKYAQIPFVLMTANDVLFPMPIQGFLRKPFAVSELLEAIENALTISNKSVELGHIREATQASVNHAYL